MFFLFYHVSARAKEKIAFVEIGCGPCRVIRRVARLVIERPKTWGSCVKYIVGVDFEVEMIERAIASLVLKERRIRDWTIYGTAHEISTATGNPLRKVREALRKRIVFLDADARLPFLRCEAITPIVAIMFGTLGNIPRMERALRTVSELCWPSGETLIVGFDRVHQDIGSERYKRLAERHFRPLQGTRWNEEEKEDTVSHVTQVCTGWNGPRDPFCKNADRITAS
jgi:SAM-dependent methyltransferase